MNTETFDILVRYVYSAGGDGDGYVICPRWKELADDFEVYAKAENIPWHRLDYHDMVLFSDMSNENLIFCNDRRLVPTQWRPEIVLEIW